MSAKVSTVPTQRSSHDFSNRIATTSTSCILCRVLCPRVLSHRHVLFDYSEAKTLSMHDDASVVMTATMQFVCGVNVTHSCKQEGVARPRAPVPRDRTSYSKGIRLPAIFCGRYE